jgi:oxaloacetate decarboxylase alpha subunit
MHEIDFVDTTFRDAQQSLWGERMNTPMMLKIAPVMDRAGFRAIDTIAISHFGFAVRHHRENPWERLRLLSKAIPNTPLSIMMPGNSIAIFKLTPGPVMALFMKRLAANGIRRVQMTTVRGDISSGVRYAKDAGLEVAVALAYTLSPLHTDAYYEKEVRGVLKLSPDVIYIKDAGGLLTPDRVRTLVPAIQRNLDGLPFELHSHCTTGLAPLCYLEAIRLGVKTFHTAISPLANGSSQPSIENILRNARSLGYSSNVDEQALEAIASHFREVAGTEGFPIGAPLEYDVGQYEHQVPGGVISNLTRQLAELGVEQRLEEVLKETALVRKEFGYPIMITPFSQFVVTQAMLNVTQGERYKTITDEVIQFALGHYGKQPIPVDQNLIDRINSLPRTKELRNWQPEEISIEDMRRQFGADLTDDELLLLVLCSEEDVKAMRKAGPIKKNYSYAGANKSVPGLIRELTKRKKISTLNIQRENFSLSLKKGTN